MKEIKDRGNRKYLKPMWLQAQIRLSRRQSEFSSYWGLSTYRQGNLYFLELKKGIYTTVLGFLKLLEKIR